MPIRWVLSPTVLHKGILKPKVATLVDRGIPPVIDEETGLSSPPFGYSHSSVLVSGGRALSFVRFIDPTEMDLDPEVINILERDYEDVEDFLSRTPAVESWNTPRLNVLKNRLRSQGAEVGDLNENTPFSEWLERLGKRFGASFEPRGTRVG